MEDRVWNRGCDPSKALHKRRRFQIQVSTACPGVQSQAGDSAFLGLGFVSLACDGAKTKLSFQAGWGAAQGHMVMLGSEWDQKIQLEPMVTSSWDGISLARE